LSPKATSGDLGWKPPGSQLKCSEMSTETLAKAHASREDSAFSVIHHDQATGVTRISHHEHAPAIPAGQ